MNTKQRLLAFGAHVDAGKALMNGEVLKRILDFSSLDEKVAFGQVNREVYNFFRKNHVVLQKYYCGLEKTTLTLKEGMVIRYLCASFNGDEELIGNYEVKRITNAGVHLRRLTKSGRKRFKKKYFMPLCFQRGHIELVAQPANCMFDDLVDSWSIIAKSKTEYLRHVANRQ
jgi:hypothetical protein